ncbi:MAG: hypothetical protein H6741_33750 [Alphaproteobacteria bacterium]|nr:hypothetical protein [Alphaproteobacteria bacterium]MCB9797682.1 hypothetical protein [Alphaproteobacteria bacterium]
MWLLLLACSSHPKQPAWAAPGFDAQVAVLEAGPGGARPVTLVMPPAPRADEALPLLLLLGGYSWQSWELDAWMGLSEVVAEQRFLLALPTATLDRRRRPFWAATDTCCDWYGAGVDDAAYLREVLATLQAEHPVDPRRIAIVGHSNGAFMGFRMACEPDSPLSALVSVAGSSWMDPARCQATHPISLLQVHGTEDEIMPWGGDHEAPPVPEVLERWAARAGCSPGSLTELGDPVELMADERPNETHVSRYQACDPGLDVALWRVDGADHYPAFSPRFVAAMLDFVRSHPRP